MNVGIFHNLPSGGAKRALMEWAKELAQRHTLWVYALATADHGFCDLRPYVAGQIDYDFAPARLFAHPFGRFNQFQRWRQLGRLAHLHKTMANAIDEAGHDVVFAHPCAFTQIPLLLQFLRTPAVYYLHESVEPASQASPPPNGHLPSAWRARVDRVDPLITLYARRLDRLRGASIAAATRLLANSEFTRDRMKSACGRESLVCRCGVDTGVFRLLPDIGRGSHVLSVGELSPRKGFAFLVEALSHIPSAGRPALRLVCNAAAVGERERLEALAENRGVQVEILRDLGTEALVREYNRAALCVYAPINEPFGLVALEAMACGTPIVAVDEGGIRESVISQRTGTLVARDPVAFGRAVASLLARPTLANDLARNARADMEKHWTWSQSCAAIETQLCAVARSSEPVAGGAPAPAGTEGAVVRATGANPG